MTKLTEQHLIDLGFKRIDVSAQESGHTSFYYYTYSFTKGFDLISSANDEGVLNVYFLNYLIGTEDFNVVNDLINVLKRMK
jgi:hypothetical protein